MIFWILVLGLALYATIMLIVTNGMQERDAVQARLGEITAIRTLQASDETSFKSLRQRVFEPAIARFSELLGKAVPRTQDQVNDLETRLRLAGYNMHARGYMGRIAVFMIMGAALGGVLGLLAGGLFQALQYALIFALGVFVLMRFSLASAVTKRKEQMEANMPDVLDLLSACVSAGLGFDQALSHVIEHMEGALVDELIVVDREMRMGKTRTAALTDMSTRCDVAPIATFVNAVVQADKLGIPIANVLVTQAESIRQYRKQRVEEKAAKLPVKILLPLVGFIFPSLLVVLLGPAMISILGAFS